MTLTTHPCPACGVPIVGARLYISGAGVLLEERDGLCSGYAVNDLRAASSSLRRPRYTEHRCPPGWDVVVLRLRDEAAVAPVTDKARTAVSKALAGRMQGPAAALPAVLERLERAGLRVLDTTTSTTPGVS